MIRRIFRLGFNELRLTFKDRSNAFWMFVMPIVFIMFFGNVIGTGQSDPSDVTISLTVVDQDVSWLSRSLVDALKGEDFAVTEVDPDELETTEGRIRTLVIPAGLADTVARGE
ncbi:MAG: hypothetical protein O7D35_03595, partial [Acidobacteria bacterium]|nr:hypothetical protein [Acidobacteriota bacterium]